MKTQCEAFLARLFVWFVFRLRKHSAKLFLCGSHCPTCAAAVKSLFLQFRISSNIVLLASPLFSLCGLFSHLRKHSAKPFLCTLLSLAKAQCEAFIARLLLYGLVFLPAEAQCEDFITRLFIMRTTLRRQKPVSQFEFRRILSACVAAFSLCGLFSHLQKNTVQKPLSYTVLIVQLALPSFCRHCAAAARACGLSFARFCMLLHPLRQSQQAGAVIPLQHGKHQVDQRRGHRSQQKSRRARPQTGIMAIGSRLSAAMSLVHHLCPTGRPHHLRRRPPLQIKNAFSRWATTVSNDAPAADDTACAQRVFRETSALSPPFCCGKCRVCTARPTAAWPW